MKKLLAIALLALGLGFAAPSLKTSADPIPRLPACTVYISDQTVPVSSFCEPYYYNGTLIFNGIYIN